MTADTPHEHEGGQPVDSLIDDLILDILNEAGRAPAAAGTKGRPSAGLLESVMGLAPRLAPGTPLVERVLLAEALAGALADALAPPLAAAIAPRILQLMEGDGGEEPGAQQRATPARSGGSRKTEK